MSTKVKPIVLGVNIDHVATLRQARRSINPSVTRAALDALDGGADYITIHLREDRRHIQDFDLVELLKKNIIINLEICPSGEMVDIAIKNRPEFCCLVPEKREELTTEGGLDLINNYDQVESAVASLSNAGIAVSLFIEPVKEFIDAAKSLRATSIELHTGNYANTKEDLRNIELAKIREAADYGKKNQLIVNAGHGLDYSNVSSIAHLDSLSELNIGHSIVSRAVTVGMKAAVSEMKTLIERKI